MFATFVRLAARQRSYVIRRTRIDVAYALPLRNEVEVIMDDVRIVPASAAVILAWLLVAALSAQPPASQGRGGGRGSITSPRNAYPDRPPGDPAAIDRGRALYGVNCAFCHGADTRGGDSGPSLLRSGVVLDDRDGELVGPILLSGR